LRLDCPDSQSAVFCRIRVSAVSLWRPQQISGHLVTIKFSSDGKNPKGKSIKSPAGANSRFIRIIHSIILSSDPAIVWHTQAALR